MSVVINELIGEYGLHETGYPNDAELPIPASHGYAYRADVRTDVTMRTSPAIWGALPTPAELTDRFRSALDPSIPVSGKRLRITGEATDPALLAKVASVYARAGMRVTVD